MEPASPREAAKNRFRHLLKTPLMQMTKGTVAVHAAGGAAAAEAAAAGPSKGPGTSPSPAPAKEKLSPGQKLLKMLKFTLKGPPNKEVKVTPDVPDLVPFGDVVGCLAVHIKQCKEFTSKFHKHRRSKLVIRIVVNRIVKFTKPRHLRTKTNKKIPEVPRRREDERNNISVELVEIESSGNLRLLGCFNIHLYEIIWKGSFTEEFEMKVKNLVFCKVEMAFMFCYGNFGYGFSHQLKPFPKLTEPSMFIRVPPPLERADPLMNVIMPQPIEYPAFLSSDLKVTIGTLDKENQISTKCVQLEKLQQQPRDRLDKMKSEYRSLKTWEEKANYLDRILIMKAGPLSQKISKECRFPGIVESIRYLPTFEAASISSMSSEASEIEEDLTFLTEEKGAPSESQSPLGEQSQEPDTSGPTSQEKLHPREPVSAVASRSSLTAGSSSSKKLAEKDRSRGSSEKTKVKVRPRTADDQSSGADRSSRSLESETKMTGSLTSRDTDGAAEQKIAASEEPLVSWDYFESFQQNLKEILVGERRGTEKQDGPVHARLRKSTLTAEAMEHEDQDPPGPPDPSGTATETPETSRWERVPAPSQEEPPDPGTDSSGEAPIGEEESASDVSASGVGAESPLVMDTTLSAEEPGSSEGSLWRAQVMLCPDSYLNNLQGQLLERLQDLFIMKSFLNKSLQGLLVAVFSPTAGKPEEGDHFPGVLEKPPDGWGIKLVEESQDRRGGRFSGTDVPRLTLGDVPREAPLESGLTEAGEAEKEEAGSSSPHPEERQPGEDRPIPRKSSSKKKHLESPAVDPEPLPSPDPRGRLTESPTGTGSVSETDPEGKSATSSEPGSGTQTPGKRRRPDIPEKVREPREGGRPETDEAGPAVLNQMLQELPIEVLLETGLIKVVELDQREPPGEEAPGSVPEKSLPENRSDYSFENPSEVTRARVEFPLDEEPLPEPSPIFEREDAGRDPDRARDGSPAEGEADPPQKEQGACREAISEGQDLGSSITDLSNNLTANLSDPDGKSLTSLLGQILQSCVTEALLGPEQKAEAREPPGFPLPGDRGSLESGGPENKRGQPRKTVRTRDGLGPRPALSESLPEPLGRPPPSEEGRRESETSKHPRDRLAGRPTEPGETADADAEKAFRAHPPVNAKTRPPGSLETDVPLRGPVHFTEPFAEIEKEIQSFLNEAHRPLADRRLASDLRYLKSFLGEILECHLHEKLFGTGTTAKREPEELLQNPSSSRGKGGLAGALLGGRRSPPGGSWAETDRGGPKPALSRSLQDLLSVLSEKEILKLKSGLSKYLQDLFLERLSRSGLLTETELGKIRRNLSRMNPGGPAPKSSDLAPLPARGPPRRESRNAESPKKPPRDPPLEKPSSTGLVRETEREGQPFSWRHPRGKSPGPREEKRGPPPREGASRPSLTAAGPVARRGAPEPPAGTPAEPLAGAAVPPRRERRERGRVQLRREAGPAPPLWARQAEGAPSGRSLEIKSLSQERLHLYNVTVRAGAEGVPPPALGAPDPGVRAALRECLPRLAPSWMNVNIFASLSSRGVPHGPHQLWGGRGREKKRAQGPGAQPGPGPNPAAPRKTVPSAQYRKEIRPVAIRLRETCRERGGGGAVRMASGPGLRDAEGVEWVTFPDVLRGEAPRPRVPGERKWEGKDVGNGRAGAPGSLPAPKPPGPTPAKAPRGKTDSKTLPRVWSARRNPPVVCCAPVRKDDADRATVHHLERAKRRAKLDLGKFPEDAPDGLPGPARPNAASDPTRPKREPGSGKAPAPGAPPPGTPAGPASPTAVSGADGPDDRRGRLERNLEKCSVVCEILHLLNENLKSKD
ncbi:C2 calcium-dependent domain-containing protein 6 isoform X2 [Ornithorhynchus anatinus]|uniref:C2 calcium-dependent domain-containing protein 6 isoform X2 n=1 Tax=Ornithorhynchus anatinus TaxID=9258 RepID=UPI0010A7FB50|nr:C2 calcium-dependent domain-containing protein 6 isoform X2 [Ornithorhynchus anatinus]